MKNLLIIFISLIIGLGFNSCKKDNISGDSKNLIEGSYITLDSVINENLDFSNDAATVSIAVSRRGVDIASVNVYLALGDNSNDASQWKLIKNIPFTGDKTILSVTTAEVAKALAPDVLQPGNQYHLENEVVLKDGRKFSDAGTPTNYTSFTVYNFAFAWSATAVCAYNEAESVGTYKVVRDTWQDYTIGDLVTVEKGAGTNQLNFLIYPSNAAGGNNQKKTVLDIDPVTGVVTIAPQVTGNYGDGTPVRVAGSGFVFSCTGGISLTIDVDYGNAGGTSFNYAGQKFVLQKQ